MRTSFITISVLVIAVSLLSHDPFLPMVREAFSESAPSVPASRSNPATVQTSRNEIAAEKYEAEIKCDEPEKAESKTEQKERIRRSFPPSKGLVSVFDLPAIDEELYARLNDEDSDELAPSSEGGPSRVNERKEEVEDKEKKSLGPYAYRIHSLQFGIHSKSVRVRYETRTMNDFQMTISGAPDYSFSDTIDQALIHTLNLGKGGEIILEVIGGDIVDEEGPDFAVFENPFRVLGANPPQYMVEPGCVSISESSQPGRWRLFPCSRSQPYQGCAGIVPVRYESNSALDRAGGDHFDLSDVGMERARFIRIQDCSQGIPFANGFDLDSVALFHTEPVE